MSEELLTLHRLADDGNPHAADAPTDAEVSDVFFGPTHVHREVIRCPECDSIQSAEVHVPTDENDLMPFAAYVHHCEACGYVILESEWEVVNAQPVTLPE